MIEEASNKAKVQVPIAEQTHRDTRGATGGKTQGVFRDFLESLSERVNHNVQLCRDTAALVGAKKKKKKKVE